MENLIGFFETLYSINCRLIREEEVKKVKLTKAKERDVTKGFRVKTTKSLK